MMAAVDIVHIPYKGGGAAVTDLIAGQVSMYFGTTPSSVPHVRTGRLRALAVDERKALCSRPGHPDLIRVRPARLRAVSVARFTGTRRHARSDRVEDQCRCDSRIAPTGHGSTARSARRRCDRKSPAELAAFIRQDIAKYAKLVKAANIQIE